MTIADETAEEAADEVVEKSMALGMQIRDAVLPLLTGNPDGRVIQAGAVQYAAGMILFALGYPLDENESTVDQLPALFVGYVDGFQFAEARGLLRAPDIVRTK